MKKQDKGQGRAWEMEDRTEAGGQRGNAKCEQFYFKSEVSES